MKPKHFIAAAVIALIAAFLPACADGRQEFTDGYRVGHIVSYAPFGISYAAEIKSGSENAVMIGGNEALITGVVWCILGLVMFGVCTKVYGKPEALDPALVATSEPPAAERAKMDREFRIWTIATVVAVVVAIALYALPMLL